MTTRVKTQGMIIYHKKKLVLFEKILANSVCHTMPQLDSLFFTFLKIRQFSPSIIWPPRADLAVACCGSAIIFVRAIELST